MTDIVHRPSAEPTRPLQIREATAADNLVLAELEDRFSDHPWSGASIARVLADSERALWLIAERDSRSVGYLAALKAPDRIEILNLAVRPECRRQGVATALLKALCRHAAGMPIGLEVRESNQAARELYRGIGFLAVGRRKAYYADNGEDAIILLKSHSRVFSDL